MNVKELIIQLLEEDLDAIVGIGNKEHNSFDEIQGVKSELNGVLVLVETEKEEEQKTFTIKDDPYNG